MMFDDKLLGERGHALLTQELMDRFMELGPQDNPDAIVVAKYFHPFSNWTWYATSFNPEDGLFFGLVDGFEAELGYWSIEDLTGEIKGIPFERDLYWTETPLREVMTKIKRERT